MTSRPKLLVRSGPVVVAHSLPAGFDGHSQCSGRVHSLTRSRSNQLGCGRPLCARPAPGPLFAQLARQVCWALSMHAGALRTSCTWFMQPLQAPRRLVSIIDRALQLIAPAIPTTSTSSSTQSGQTILPEAQRGTPAKAPCQSLLKPYKGYSDRSRSGWLDVRNGGIGRGNGI